MTITTRLARLERGRPKPGEPCPGPPTWWAAFCPEQGDPSSEVPEDAPACEWCDEVHAMLIEEVIVTAPEASTPEEAMSHGGK